MPKVALVAHELQTVLDGRAGGVATFVTHLARLLRDAGNEVTLILTRQETFPVRVDAPWRARYSEWGIELIELHSKERDAGDWCEAWPAALSEQLAPYLLKFDIAYFQDWANVAFHAARMKRLGRIFDDRGHSRQMPVLVTVLHGPSGWIRVGNQQYPEVPSGAQVEYIERYAARYSDRVVAPSRYLLDWARTNGWRFEQEPEVAGLPCLPPAPRGGVPALKSTQRIIFFGRLETRKGVRLFLAAILALWRTDRDALSSVREIVFLGEEQEAGMLTSIRSGLAETGREIIHLPHLDSLQAGSYLAEQAGDSLVIIASPVENFPYAVIETSMIPGINLLCSNGGGIPEIFAGGNRDHLFEPYPMGLAKKMAERLRDPSLAKTLVPYAADVANQRWLSLHRRALLTPRRQPSSSQTTPQTTVDVCIPYFDKAAGLRQLLESLERQTTSSFGVIAVNDGSSSEAAEAFHTMGDLNRERGWTFVSQENAFVDAARNHAASLSSAEYLLFVDADDMLAPNTIEAMLQAISFSGDDCLVAGGLLFEGEDSPCEPMSGRLQAPVQARYMPLGPDLLNALLDPIVLGASMILVRRSAFEAIDGYRTVRGAAHEDWELQIRLVQAGFRVDVLPEYLLYFRKSSAGLSLTSDAYEAKRRLLDTYEDALSTAGLRGLATSVVALQRRCEKLEAAVKTIQGSRDRLLNGLAKEMRRKGMQAKQEETT